MRDRAFVGIAIAMVLGTAACSSAPVGDDDTEFAPDKQTTKPKPGEKPEGSEETASLTIDVEAPEGRVDRSYTFDLRPKDTTGAPRAYRLAEGELPAGVTLAEDGTLSGSPSASGIRKATVVGEGPCGDASCRLEVRLTMKVPDVVLLSGFGPFQDVPVNPSWQAVEPLDDTMVAGYDVRVIQVPVDWDEAVVKYFAAYDRLHPVMALTSGVAVNETGIRLETTARNFASGPDVGNEVWPAGPIEAEGAETYKTRLPVDLLKSTLEQATYPVLLSDNAGDYLCNFLFYGLMRKLDKPTDAHVLAGFVHVPGPDVVAPAKMTEAWKLMIARLGTHQKQLVANGVVASSPRALDVSLPIVHTPPRY